MAWLIADRHLDIRPYKFIVLLCGKVDLKESDGDSKEGLHGMLRVINEQDPLAITVLTAVLPTPGDSKNLIRVSGYRSRYMAKLAEDVTRIEFSKPGKRLLRPGGAIIEFFDDFGNLNVKGLEQISRGLVAKFACAKLRQKYDQFKAGEVGSIPDHGCQA